MFTSAIVTAKSVQVINEKTGAWTRVEPNANGRVPKGYRVPTSQDRAMGRGAELRFEIARLSRAGRFDEAEQAQRTLADARASGIAI
jgi:hypothetical protein